MTGKEFERLTRKYLLPHLPGFRAKGPLVIVVPIHQLLRALAFDSSGFDPSAFNVWAFVQPLYVPVTHIHFTFGGRLGALGGGTERRWRFQEGKEEELMSEVLAYIKSEGLPFLDRLKSPIDLAGRAIELTSAPDNVHVLEAMAYSLILGGRSHEALPAFARLDRALASMDPDVSPWIQEIAERAEQVRRALVRGPEDSIGLLNEWREQTVKNLRIS